MPPDDIFNDRPDRDSAIDIKSVREAVEAQGFAGPFRDREFSIDWEGGVMKSCGHASRAICRWFRCADPKCFVNDLRKGKFAVYVDDPDR